MDHAPSPPGTAVPKCAPSGVDGLDEVLSGGFVIHRLYLVEGVPGSGKTTLALQFLLDGVAHGEPVLYVTLSESSEELESVAASHGWSLAGITVRELAPSEESLRPDEQYTMFHPSEVELSETTRAILADVERLKPTRVVFDSLSELRLLAGNPLRYRRQILALKHFFGGRNCTVLLLDDLTSESHDLQVQSIAHGVVRLEQLFPGIGAERRRLLVVKYRGVHFRGGYHDYIIQRGGLRVFPRLVTRQATRRNGTARLTGGVPGLDLLLGGGLEPGTSTLVVGSPGTGKSTLAAQFVFRAAERGQAAAMFIFDESLHTLLSRTSQVGIDLRKHVESGRVTIQSVDPVELSPGELAHAIREQVETRNAAIIVLDSLNGYLNAMPEERFLIIQLHELLSYLGQSGVATILIGAHQGLVGATMQAPVDASYLADAIILLRYFEAGGEVRQAISVLKKRGGAHERTIREFNIGADGLRIGEPLRGFRGVLTGVPTPLGPAGTGVDEDRR
jgi:circadian clock protein KaiC